MAAVRVISKSVIPVLWVLGIYCDGHNAILSSSPMTIYSSHEFIFFLCSHACLSFLFLMQCWLASYELPAPWGEQRKGRITGGIWVYSTSTWWITVLTEQGTLEEEGVFLRGKGHHDVSFIVPISLIDENWLNHPETEEKIIQGHQPLWEAQGKRSQCGGPRGLRNRVGRASAWWWHRRQYFTEEWPSKGKLQRICSSWRLRRYPQFWGWGIRRDWSRSFSVMWLGEEDGQVPRKRSSYKLGTWRNNAGKPMQTVAGARISDSKLYLPILFFGGGI